MVLSPKELDAVAEGVAARLPMLLINQQRLLDRQSLAQHLGISVATIERLTRFGKISVIRAGSRCLYDVNQVLAAGSASEDGGVK